MSIIYPFEHAHKAYIAALGSSAGMRFVSLQTRRDDWRNRGKGLQYIYKKNHWLRIRNCASNPPKSFLVLPVTTAVQTNICRVAIYGVMGTPAHTHAKR